MTAVSVIGVGGVISGGVIGDIEGMVSNHDMRFVRGLSVARIEDACISTIGESSPGGDRSSQGISIQLVISGTMIVVFSVSSMIEPVVFSERERFSDRVE